MFRPTLSRGVCACASTIAFSSSVAFAQEALPTIDVGAEQRAPASAAVSGRAEPKTPTEGYVVHTTETGTKMDVPSREIPVSVNVVPKQVIADQNITRLQDALENIPGVRVNSTDAQGHVFKIRGFTVIGAFRNNLSDAGLGTSQVTDLANVERIEVLKGPASILYGRSEPGGVVNVTTKQPLDRPLYVLQQEFGSFDYYRTQWDFSAPVKEVPGLAYRISGAYQDNGSFRDFQGGRRLLVAPVVKYSPTPWTEIIVDAQFLSNKVQSDLGIPVWPSASGSQPAPIPLSRSLQDPNDPRDRSDSYNISYSFRQNLDENWKVTNRFLFTHQYLDTKSLVPLSIGADNRTISRSAQNQTVDADVFSTNIDFEGKFDALYGRHTFLIGLDYMNRYFDYYFANANNLSFPIDLFSPVYGTVPSAAFDAAVIGSGLKAHSSHLYRQKGLYVQDHVNFLDDRLHLLLGARYDVADVVQGFSRSSGGNYSASAAAAIADRLRARDRVDTGWSPRAGLVYDLTPELGVYASYSRSFGATNGLSTSGEAFPPQHGVQWEGGLKAQFPSDVSATLAFYQLTKSNILTRDFSSPDPAARKLAGLQRSRGIELDILGRVTDRIGIIANYAYTDAKVIADNWRNPLNPFGSGLLGNHLDNVPRHSGKIWLTYDFGENGLGWRVGGGVTAATQVWGDLQNTFVLPGWARLDGFASYATMFEGHKITAQLNLRNITNTQYFTGADFFFNAASPRMAALPAAPFTATGTVRFEW